MPNIIINCDHIKFIPAVQVESIIGDVVTPKTGFELHKLKAMRVIIKESHKHAEPGDVVTQTLQIDYFESTQVINNLLRLPQIVVINRNDELTKIFGSIDNPAVVKGTGITANRGQFSFKRTAKDYEFISGLASQY